jgi:hypothetical protein
MIVRVVAVPVSTSIDDSSVWEKYNVAVDDRWCRPLSQRRRHHIRTSRMTFETTVV